MDTGESDVESEYVPNSCSDVENSSHSSISNETNRKSQSKSNGNSISKNQRKHFRKLKDDANDSDFEKRIRLVFVLHL